MWKRLALVLFLVLVGCKQTSVVQAETGITVTHVCSPVEGTYDVYLTETTAHGVSCGAQLHWVQTWTLSKHPMGMHLSDDLCAASGSGPLTNGGTYEAYVSFDDDWEDGSGTFHMHALSCDSSYAVTMVRRQ